MAAPVAVKSPSASSSTSIKIAIIVLSAVLYTAGKAITAPIQTPWHVGQLLVGIFLPAFLALTADTVPAAIGAGLGTFIGDVFFLVPLGATTPILSLVAGVPANFVGILLFGWFAKKYKTWGAFVASTISFVTLGNLIAAVAVVLFLSLPTNLILGFVVFWNSTSIPAILLGVPILVRAVGPLYGHSRIITYEPAWGASFGGRDTTISLVFAVIFLAIGGAFFFLALPNPIEGFSATYFTIAAALVLILAPVAGILAGSRLRGKQIAS